VAVAVAVMPIVSAIEAATAVNLRAGERFNIERRLLRSISTVPEFGKGKAVPSLRKRNKHGDEFRTIGGYPPMVPRP
jgi:hypothetical protein